MITGAWWTANHTLIRKRTVIIGDNDGLDSFNPSIEWDSLSVDTWSNLGTHICDCIDGSVSTNNIYDISHIIYPNPANIGDVVTISANDKIKSIEIFNSLGEKILSTKSSRFNTSSLSKGTYIAHIKLRDSQILKKSISSLLTKVKNNKSTLCYLKYQYGYKILRNFYC